MVESPSAPGVGTDTHHLLEDLPTSQFSPEPSSHHAFVDDDALEPRGGVAATTTKRVTAGATRHPSTSAATIVPTKTNYVNVTSSTVRPPVSAANVATSSGAVSGQLTTEFAVADVPLQGPGTWLLVASAATSQSLHCGTQVSPVTSRVVIGASQACQFEISAVSPSNPITWRLSPIP